MMSKEAYDLLFSMMSEYKHTVIDKLPAGLYQIASKLWQECWTTNSERCSKDYPDGGV